MKKKPNRIHYALYKLKVTLLELFRCCKYREKLKENLKYQGLYLGNQKCFVIGNGPSLREEDLERIARHHVVSFAANRIYKIFQDTTWRPTYYGVSDTTLFINSKEEIDAIQCKKFLPLDIYDKYVDKRESYGVFSRVPFTFFGLRPKFTNRIDRRFGEGGTITYHLLQLAVSMGFKEIYLIGCDFSFSFGIGVDGKYFEDKSVKLNHHKRDNNPVDTMPNLLANLRAYQAAEKYTRKHGIKIYNATRGGKLEVFERRDFDTLF